MPRDNSTQSAKNATNPYTSTRAKPAPGGTSARLPTARYAPAQPPSSQLATGHPPTRSQPDERRPPAQRAGPPPPQSSRPVSSSTNSSTQTFGGPHQPLRIETAHLSTGETREYVVLDDSPTPPPKKRTRNVVAAATTGGASDDASGSGMTSSSGTAAAARKRKVEEQAVGGSGKRPAYAYDQRQPVASTSGTEASSSRRWAPPPTAAADPPAPPAWDDAEGHLIIIENELLHHGRYRVIKKLGEGTFARVVEAFDRTTRKAYAVKIVRAVPRYRDASKIEIRVLNELKRGDPGNENKCVHLMDCFDHKNHVCLVFELLGPSVFDFVKETSCAPFPMAHIQEFGRQLITSIAYLHKLGLVHTDLKPENILLADSSHRFVESMAGGPERLVLNNPDVRLIDFGSATFEKEYHSTVVSTRHYRAPEIVLGLGWSFPCDMFSVGCILIEFITGEALFQTHGNLEHLAMMEIVMGKMPTNFVERAARLKPELFKDGKLDYPNETTDKASKKILRGMKRLEGILVPTDADRATLLDLIKQLLRFDPATRLDAKGALSHRFFTSQIASSPNGV